MYVSLFKKSSQPFWLLRIKLLEILLYKYLSLCFQFFGYISTSGTADHVIVFLRNRQIGFQQLYYLTLPSIIHDSNLSTSWTTFIFLFFPLRHGLTMQSRLALNCQYSWPWSPKCWESIHVPSNLNHFSSLKKPSHPNG